MRAGPHPPTCLCEACERGGGGDFAVRAYCEGDRSALRQLSPLAVRGLQVMPIADRATRHTGTALHHEPPMLKERP